MKKQILALAADKSLGVDVAQQLPMIRHAGFDGAFAQWTDEQTMAQWSQIAAECGLVLPLMHAPFRKAKAIWNGPDSEAEEGVAQLIDCIRSCAAHEVPVIVTHAYIGIDNEEHRPTQEGLERYYRVLRAAEGTGVTVAFENTEGEEYLEALFANFSDHPQFGFCWDSGHELCYNRLQDMLGRYGSRLCATHLNDNMGITAADASLSTGDDLHLIPFDGVVGWVDLAVRLAAADYDGALTFELKRQARGNTRYLSLSPEEYLSACYRGASRVAALVEQARKMQKNA
jgi:sugar phosphate isomerase/epimerase